MSATTPESFSKRSFVYRQLAEAKFEEVAERYIQGSSQHDLTDQ